MATYPTDATAPITAFPVTSTVTFSSTGAVATVFNLATSVTHAGEVAAFIDGVLQQTTSYSISNSGATATFLSPPNASNLTLQTVSVPPALKRLRATYSSLSAEYSNTAATVINGNSYLINAHQTAFALPGSANIVSSSDLQVYLSGVYQHSDAYTYPSVTLGVNGIDIADNAATKLLTNFFSALTDESDSAHTVTFVGGTAAYATFGADKYVTLDGTNDYLQIPSSDDFNVNDRSFTLDTWVRPDTGTSMTSNQTLFARHDDATNNYNLRLVGANSNVGFVINRLGGVTELYGGNANGGSNYHVAVSYDATTNNLRLYVNNVKVAHKNYVAATATGGNVSIGANSNTTTAGEFFNGGISFVRLAHVARYRTATIQPITSSNALSVQSGAPLGAETSADTLTIRSFTATVDTSDRFTSMADRKPDKGISSSRAFDVNTFASQAGYEKRRLRSRRSKRSYDLKYSSITGVEKTAIENFYNSRSGEFESFSFDLAHLNETGTITARFQGPLSIEQTYSTGARLIDNFYTVSFNLQEVFD
jgi:hypothetical protein|tara:strand:+ start:533 stop:2143 length:1611 start_codon:yes stop_codon:yes gene_type:complete